MIMHPSGSGFIKAAMVSLAFGSLAPAALAETTVTAVMHAPLRALDPVISTAYILRNYGYMVYDTLLARDSEGNPMPQMADWTVSDDGMVYTFTLRDGLLWHDGTPVTAEDCVTSVTRWSKYDKTGQIMTSLMSDMSVVDDKTFTMTFSEPTAIVLTALSKPSGLPPFMFPKDVADRPDGDPITTAIGSGPFKFVMEEYKPGVSATFVKNEDYVPLDTPSNGLAGGKVVMVDKVVWTSMPDPMTAVNALMSDEIDFIEQLPHDLLPLVDGNPDFTVATYEKQGSQNLVRMNFTLPPFDNPEMRRAVMLALGQQPVLDAQVGAGSQFGKACPAIFGCASPYASDYRADEILESHPEEAKKILEAEGYDGTPILLMHATDLAMLAAHGPVIAQQLRDAGFEVDMVSMDWASLSARRASKAPIDEGGWNIFSTYNVLPDVGDPIGFVGVAAGGDDAWFGWPDVPEIEAARATLARTSDLDEVKALAAELDKLAKDNSTMYPMGEFYSVAVSAANVHMGVDAEAPVFWNVTKED
ncbi:ABC transporter substrate-binding protein [Sulfitobacter pontiacus]|uniref:ABC transporter substrate-binding protein n=1 Tax=Sulfitobacter pontiacus TaxID=60137 RepID=UPI003266850D